jgi:hypothetical protein
MVYSQQFALGTPTPLTTAARIVRGHAIGDDFWAVAVRYTPSLDDPTLDLLHVAPGGDPASAALHGNALADDAAIDDLGGAPALDVVVIESGNLGVYADLAPGSPDYTPTSTFGSRDNLPDYDLLAVGNFHGGSQHEIYVLASTHAGPVPLCYRLVDVAKQILARCASE